MLHSVVGDVLNLASRDIEAQVVVLGGQKLNELGKDLRLRLLLVQLLQVLLLLNCLVQSEHAHIGFESFVKLRDLPDVHVKLFLLD